MKMKTIVALALTAFSLAFTLPSVAAGHNFYCQSRSAPVAYQQANDSIEQLQINQDELSARLDKVIKALDVVFYNELSVRFTDDYINRHSL